MSSMYSDLNSNLGVIYYQPVSTTAFLPPVNSGCACIPCMLRQIADTQAQIDWLMWLRAGGAWQPVAKTQQQVPVVALYDPQPAYIYDASRTQQSSPSSATGNGLQWNVVPQHRSADPGVESVLRAYGKPDTDNIKAYQTLGDLGRFDVTNEGKHSDGTRALFYQAFDANRGLHFGSNQYLKDSWNDPLESYGGQKQEIQLYTHNRSQFTGELKGTLVGATTLNQILQAMNGKPAEVHHVLFKALYPRYAVVFSNLMLTYRAKKESVDGMGQHELWHYMSTSDPGNKFKVESKHFVDTYLQWLADSNITVHVSKK